MKKFFGKEISNEFVKVKVNSNPKYMIKTAKKFGKIAKLKQLNCYVCNSTKSKQIINFYGINYVMCQNCSHVYTDRRMSEEQLTKHYSEDKDYFKHVYPNKKILKLRMDIFLPKIKFSKKYSKGKKWLDIGSGDGTVVAAANKQGFKAEGIELSKAGREFAKKYLNIKLSDKPLEEFCQNNKKFDVVSYFGVLEHIPDPVNSLTHSNRILNKNGILVLEVPHYNALTSAIQKLSKTPDRHLIPSTHIMIFTLKSIKHILKKTGFIPIVVWFFGSDIIELLKFIQNSNSGFKKSELMEILSNHINELQTVFDRSMLSDGLLIIGKKIKEV